ncbi:hypothetical protein BDN70DRAFT_938571 [Pholiota conissans]|uniref:Uncharacterized protein n=1 Tax=Pholiota conissans TaxID=109636 RepID=A0A9P5YMK4_9AGAR|nr:hypothetical protein BDN70DRAFT_938571 [Pholiota conissans]
MDPSELEAFMVNWNAILQERAEKSKEHAEMFSFLECDGPDLLGDGIFQFTKVYFYHCEFKEGPKPPNMIFVSNITDSRFKYAQCPGLVKLVNHRHHEIEFWNHHYGCWETLNCVRGIPCSTSSFHDFIIIRRADHSTNAHLVGLAELVRELDYLCGRRYSPTPLSPDNTCPPDNDWDVKDPDWLSLASGTGDLGKATASPPQLGIIDGYEADCEADGCWEYVRDSMDSEDPVQLRMNETDGYEADYEGSE